MAYQRVKFGDYYIGDHAWVESRFSGSTLVRTIPRLTGAKIYSLNSIGGGHISIVVHAWIKKDTRKELEEYLIQLPANLGYTKKTITYGDKTISNCALQAISSDSGYERWSFFSATFIAELP